MKYDEKYDESVDEDGNVFHFRGPKKMNGVNGYQIVDGPSPLGEMDAEKRKRLRAKRNKLKKHKRRIGN